MPSVGVNMAVTVDGEPYNKLRRPDQLPGLPVASSSSKEDTTTAPTLPPTTVFEKRKRTEEDIKDLGRDEGVRPKRLRANAGPKKAGKLGSRGPPKDAPGRLPVSDDERSSDDECTIQAREYLRHAREEEKSLNQALLLVDAPPQIPARKLDRSTHTNERGNARASYQHGYYFARDTRPQADPFNGPSDLQPQEQYYKMLLKRYKATRMTIAKLNAHRDQLLQRMNTERSESTSIEAPKNRHDWLYTLDREYPTPAQINQLDGHGVARGLKYSAHGMDRSDCISKQKSCWIWALLAKAGEVDTMLSEKVSPIRDLALKAGQLGVRLRGTEMQRLESDEDDDNIEDWHVDDIELDFKGSEHSSEDIELPRNHPESSDSDAELPAEAIGALQRVAEPVEQAIKQDREPKDEYSAESGADMSMSEEGEVQDDTEPATLEEARARLFAQLGDRLVQHQANSDSQKQKAEKGELQGSVSSVKGQGKSLLSSHSSSPPRAARHRHNGKICHDSKCAVGKRRRLSQQKAGHRAAADNGTYRGRSSSPYERPIPSRAEAEAQRQAMREKELLIKPRNDTESNKATVPPMEGIKSGDVTTDETSRPLQKVFASRTEAEDYRQQQLELATARSAEETHNSAQQKDIEMNDDEMPDLNTRVTIDMILTVAAECYGQKDLLKYRDSWT